MMDTLQAIERARIMIRLDGLGLAAVMTESASLALPWWAWRRRRNMMQHAHKLVRIAEEAKAELTACEGTAS